MSRQLWIKTETYSRGKKLMDLSAAVNCSYSQLSQYVNGLRALPPELENRIRLVFCAWDKQKPTAIVPPLSGSAARLIRNMSRPIG